MPAELTPERAAGAELVDIGTGIGRSLRSAEKVFGVPGVGLDLNKKKVREARQRGLRVFYGDVTELDPAMLPDVRYVTIDNVLEHLEDLDAVERVLTAAVRMASDAVYIRHPSFEHEDYLAGLGLKQFWCDWPDAHSCHVRLADFARMAFDLGVYRILVQPVQRALDSDDPTLLPLSAPRDQRRRQAGDPGVYDPERHDPKPHVALVEPVYFAFDILLVTGERMGWFEYPGDPEVGPERPRIHFYDSAATAGEEDASAPT